MSRQTLRQQVAIEAARVMFRHQEQDPYRATLRAARKLFRGWLKPSEFPSEGEIRMHLQQMSWMHTQDVRFDNLQELRQAALPIMQRLSPWSPILTGTPAAGTHRHGQSLRIYVFCDSPDQIVRVLPATEINHRFIPRLKQGVQTEWTCLEFIDRFRFQIVCVPESLRGRTLRQKSTGKPVPVLTLEQLEDQVEPDATDSQTPGATQGHNRYELYRMLLAPLASIHQKKSSHPEGDALYHSLQVFELARNYSAWDEEFLLAALLHDVGKGMDALEPTAAGLKALKGSITDRTEWLIANLPDAHRLTEGTLGGRAKRRLRESPDYDDLMELARCDREGRIPGGSAPDMDAAVDYIRDVARMCGEQD